MTPLPSLDRTSPTFRSDLDAFFLTKIPTFVTEANALQVDVTAKASATTAAVDAALAAGLSNAAANAAQTTVDRIQTGEDRASTRADRAQTGLDRVAVNEALGSIADGPVSSVGGATGVVALKTLNGQALVGAGNIIVEPSIYRDVRTANAAILAADRGKLIDMTSGTFTQTFAPAAVLGNGWYAHLRNSGTGVIALDPSESELIDGRTTIRIYPGESFVMVCDGVGFACIGRAKSVRLSETTNIGEVASWSSTVGFDDPEFVEIEVTASRLWGTTQNVYPILAFRSTEGDVAGDYSWSVNLSAAGSSAYNGATNYTAAGLGYIVNASSNYTWSYYFRVPVNTTGRARYITEISFDYGSVAGTPLVGIGSGVCTSLASSDLRGVSLKMLAGTLGGIDRVLTYGVRK